MLLSSGLARDELAKCTWNSNSSKEEERGPEAGRQAMLRHFDGTVSIP
jgi:hypothetical protein